MQHLKLWNNQSVSRVPHCPSLVTLYFSVGPLGRRWGFLQAFTYGERVLGVLFYYWLGTYCCLIVFQTLDSFKTPSSGQ